VTFSNTFAFAPSIGDLILSAYSRIGIRRTQIVQEHMQDGQREANLWLLSASNRGPNLWTVDLQSTALVSGQVTYTVPPETVMVLDLYVETADGLGNVSSTTISALSRTDYAGISNKLQQGRPTSFWFDRLIAPTVYLWPVPDASGPYVLRYYRYRQMMDANLAGGQNVELPALFLDAFVAGLSHRLARIYAIPLEAVRKVDAEEAWQIAATQNTENVPVNMSPQLDGYFN
jgi:hypothetical protein